MEKEIWKPVPSLDGLLQVSNLGNVREYVEAIVKGKKIIYKNRQISVFPNAEKKQKITYKNKSYLVSRLVAETFIKEFGKTYGNLYGNAVISKYKLQKIILQLYGGFLCGLQI